jgi:hypothetical protein
MELTVYGRQEPREDSPPLAATVHHDVQATGMLSAIVAPLAAARVPVWVVSSFDGDLVLVPADRLDEVSGVLQAIGHQVRR